MPATQTGRQAITTRYHGPTNTMGSRISARCDASSRFDMMKLKIIADTRNLACPTCREHVNQAHAITQCSNCEHVSHADCYAEMGCGAWECSLGGGSYDWLNLDGERYRLDPDEEREDTWDGLWGAIDQRQPYTTDVLGSDGNPCQIVFYDRSHAEQAIAEMMRSDPEVYVDEETLKQWALECIRGGATASSRFDGYVESHAQCSTERALAMGSGDGQEIDCPQGVPYDYCTVIG